jgi:transposase
LVVIALIFTPEGFPLAYDVLAGNTQDEQTLADFLKKIEEQYGKAERIWVMDRGIPTERVLAQMRTSNPPVRYSTDAQPANSARQIAASR